MLKMATAYLITYKPRVESPELGMPLEDLHRLVEERAAGKQVVENWRFRNAKVWKGDRVFLLLQGKGGPAIIGYGRVDGPVREISGTPMAPVEFEALVDSARDALVSRQELLALKRNDIWGTRQSGILLDPKIADFLEERIAVQSARPIVKDDSTSRMDANASVRIAQNETPAGIPDGISREHIEQALRNLASGVAHEFGGSRRWDVIFEGRRFAPKAVLGRAAEILAGRVFKPGDFQGGEESRCNRILAENGFAPVLKTDRTPEREAEEDEAERQINERADISETEKLSLVKARRGQGLYRFRLEQIEHRCRVTG
ncbi:MAG: hypothetical protein ACREUG_03815, partial [Steroidobacteraceae bacterium]